MRPHAVWITLLAGGTALILAECGPLAGAPKAAPQALSAPLGAPTLEERKNAACVGLRDLAGPVTLKDGRWEGEPFEPGAASRPTLSLAPGFRLTGDIDGDGAEEAVVNDGVKRTPRGRRSPRSGPAATRGSARTPRGCRRPRRPR